jgi:hypothetical protein
MLHKMPNSAENHLNNPKHWRCHLVDARQCLTHSACFSCSTASLGHLSTLYGLHVKEEELAATCRALHSCMYAPRHAAASSAQWQ